MIENYNKPPGDWKPFDGKVVEPKPIEIITKEVKVEVKNDDKIVSMRKKLLDKGMKELRIVGYKYDSSIVPKIVRPVTEHADIRTCIFDCFENIIKFH